MRAKAPFLLLLLLLLLSACGTDTDSTQSPLDITRRYLEAERVGAYSDMYALLTSDSQLKIGSTEFADRLSRARASFNITKIDVVSVGLPDPNTRVNDAIVVGQRASVPYTVIVTFKDNTHQTLVQAMTLLKQNNGWRVVWPPA